MPMTQALSHDLLGSCALSETTSRGCAVRILGVAFYLARRVPLFQLIERPISGRHFEILTGWKWPNCVTEIERKLSAIATTHRRRLRATSIKPLTVALRSIRGSQISSLRQTLANHGCCSRGRPAGR